MGHNNSIILGRKGYGWGEYPHYYLNYDIGKYGFPEGTDGRIATQVNIWLKDSSEISVTSSWARKPSDSEQSFRIVNL